MSTKSNFQNPLHKERLVVGDIEWVLLSHNIIHANNTKKVSQVNALEVWKKEAGDDGAIDGMREVVGLTVGVTVSGSSSYNIKMTFFAGEKEVVLS